MSREKQIKEIEVLAEDILQEYTNCYSEVDKEVLAEMIYTAGYRKQSEGEWIGKTDYAGYGYYCSNCNAVFRGENAEWIAKEHLYCPKCGAYMRKEDEGK